MSLWKRLLNENTWHGKLIAGICAIPKVAIVLVFFTGVFAVIAFDSLVLRLKRNARAKAGGLRPR